MRAGTVATGEQSSSKNVPEYTIQRALQVPNLQHMPS